MRSLGWALTPDDRCPYKRRRLGPGHAQRETLGGHGQTVAVHKLRKEASEETDLVNASSLLYFQPLEP